MLAAVDRERKQAMKLVLIDTSFKPDNASASAGRSIPPYAAQRIRAQRADRLRVPQLWLLGALLFAPQLSARFLASARSRLQIQQTLVEVVVVVAMVVAFVVVVVAAAAAGRALNMLYVSSSFVLATLSDFHGLHTTYLMLLSTFSIQPLWL